MVIREGAADKNLPLRREGGGSEKDYRSPLTQTETPAHPPLLQMTGPLGLHRPKHFATGREQRGVSVSLYGRTVAVDLCCNLTELHLILYNLTENISMH